MTTPAHPAVGAVPWLSLWQGDTNQPHHTQPKGWPHTCWQHPVVGGDDALDFFLQVLAAWAILIQLEDVERHGAGAQVNGLWQEEAAVGA